MSANPQQRTGKFHQTLLTNSHYPYSTHTIYLHLMHHHPCGTNLRSLKTPPVPGNPSEAISRKQHLHTDLGATDKLRRAQLQGTMVSLWPLVRTPKFNSQKKESNLLSECKPSPSSWAYISDLISLCVPFPLSQPLHRSLQNPKGRDRNLIMRFLIMRF